MVDKNKFKIENPLVSVTVITYNSSRFVLETLESIQSQTYKNLELIISDDCSSDDTVAVCNKWLKENKKSFNRVKLITHHINTGIAGNKNRANRECHGTWIKGIAGDDKLLPSCIADNIAFSQTDDHNFIFSRPQIINDRGEIDHSDISPERYTLNNDFFNLDAESQFLHLIIKNHPINPPTLFSKRKSIEELGGLDESFPIEDFPFYLDATSKGFKLTFFNKETIQYRVHSSSFSQSARTNTAVSYWKILRFRKILKKYINFRLFLRHPFIVIEYYNHYFFNELLILLGNKKSHKAKLKYLRYFSPIIFMDRISNLKKRFYQ